MRHFRLCRSLPGSRVPCALCSLLGVLSCLLFPCRRLRAQARLVSPNLVRVLAEHMHSLPGPDCGCLLGLSESHTLTPSTVQGAAAAQHCHITVPQIWRRGRSDSTVSTPSFNPRAPPGVIACLLSTPKRVAPQTQTCKSRLDMPQREDQRLDSGEKLLPPKKACAACPPGQWRLIENKGPEGAKGDLWGSIPNCWGFSCGSTSVA